MNRPKLFKALRIAFSATCIVVAVLLCLLWVRSYDDQYYGLIAWDNSFELGSEYGYLAIFVGSDIWETTKESHWEFVDETDYTVLFPIILEDVSPGLHWYNDVDGSFWAAVPHVIVISMFAALAAVPWIRWSRRFSLRTLLIATTLVAVVLGLAVWTTE